MTSRAEKRVQMLFALGLVAIGLTAFLLDDHETVSWKTLTPHQAVQLCAAAIGLLLFPLDMATVKEKVTVIRDIIALRRPSAAVKSPPDSV